MRLSRESAEATGCQTVTSELQRAVRRLAVSMLTSADVSSTQCVDVFIRMSTLFADCVASALSLARHELHLSIALMRED